MNPGFIAARAGNAKRTAGSTPVPGPMPGSTSGLGRADRQNRAA
jgi:hypothetical protein